MVMLVNIAPQANCHTSNISDLTANSQWGNHDSVTTCTAAVTQYSGEFVALFRVGYVPIYDWQVFQ